MIFFFTASLGLQAVNYETFSKTSYVPVQPYFGQATFSDAGFRAQFKNVRRFQRIANKYYALPLQQRRQLAALCDPQYRYPPELRSSFKKPGLSLFTKLAKTPEELIKLTKNAAQVKIIQKEIDDLYQTLTNLWTK